MRGILPFALLSLGSSNGFKKICCKRVIIIIIIIITIIMIMIIISIN